MAVVSETGLRLKEIGWNGIRVSLPPAWHPAAIGPCRLLFEDDQGPTMEMRWQGAMGGRGRNKIYRQLHRAAKSHQCVFKEMTPPGPWQQALKYYNVSGFSWTGRFYSARGVVIHCPRCGKVTLLQFYYSPERSDPQLFERILSTFCDHGGKSSVTYWSIFDIGLELSSDYRLAAHSFAAGAFQLNFKRKGVKVNFYRFAPASVLLAEQSLDDFSKGRWPVNSNGAMEKITHSDRTAIIYRGFAAAKPYQRILNRCMGRKTEAWIRAWHLKDKNRIHAVQIESSLQDPQTILSTMADKFSHV